MGDANGVEALAGESEAEYVARQTRLREEAAARMRAKFGGSGGLNGRLGGVGSGGCGSCGSSYNSSSGGGGVLNSAYEALPSRGEVGAGLGTAASVVGATSSWLFGKVAETASAVASKATSRSSEGAANGGDDDVYTNDISDLLSGGAARDGSRAAPAPAPVPQNSWNGGERDPGDLSDLLSGASLDPSPPRAQRSSAHTPPPTKVGDNFFGDANWGSGGGQDFGSDGKVALAGSEPEPTSGGT